MAMSATMNASELNWDRPSSVPKLLHDLSALYRERSAVGKGLAWGVLLAPFTHGFSLVAGPVIVFRMLRGPDMLAPPSRYSLCR